jgi:phage-related protein
MTLLENDADQALTSLSDTTTLKHGTRLSRPVQWIKAALKEFQSFPREAQLICLRALTIAGEGDKADIAKPMKGFGSGVFEIALPHRGDAFRVVYALQIDEELWVVHAFKKKSTQGIKTPKHQIDLIADRLKRLKQIAKEAGK